MQREALKKKNEANVKSNPPENKTLLQRRASAYWAGHLFWGKWQLIGSLDLLFKPETSVRSSLCSASPSGTLRGSDRTAGDGRGLSTVATGKLSLVQVVWVS